MGGSPLYRERINKIWLYRGSSLYAYPTVQNPADMYVSNSSADLISDFAICNCMGVIIFNQ